MKVAKRDKMEAQEGRTAKSKLKKNPNDTTTPKQIRKPEGQKNTGEAGTSIGSWHDDYVGARDARIDPDDRLETARNDIANPKKRVAETKEAMQEDADLAEEHEIDSDSTNKEEVEEAIADSEGIEEEQEEAEDEAEENNTRAKRTAKTAKRSKKRSGKAA